MEKLADFITKWIASHISIALHTALLLIAGFFWSQNVTLTYILSVYAIILALLILNSSNRQQQQDEKREKADLATDKESLKRIKRIEKALYSKKH